MGNARQRPWRNPRLPGGVPDTSTHPGDTSTHPGNINTHPGFGGTSAHGRQIVCPCEMYDGDEATQWHGRCFAEYYEEAQLEVDHPGDWSPGRIRFFWYDHLTRWAGIHGIRMQLPPCVTTLIEEYWGPSQTGFTAGANPCQCSTCKSQ